MSKQNPPADETISFDQMAPQWLYDKLMSQIEPDLVSSKLPLLDEKYRGETEDDRVVRLEHYDAAFELFEAALQQLQTDFMAEVRSYKQQKRDSLIAEDQVQTNQAMDRLDSEMHDADLSQS